MKSNKIKVLVFIDWFLPGYKAGGPTRSLANMIDFLHDEIDFYVVTRSTDYLQTESYKNIEVNKWTKNFNANIYYISPDKLSYSTIKQLIKNTDCDVLYINGVYSFYFSILPVLFSKGKKRLVAARGMLAKTAIEIKSTKKSLFLQFAKFWGWYKNVFFHATNSNELQDIKNIFSDNEILIAPNFPKKISFKNFDQKPKQPGELRLFSLARIAPEKNLLFALQTLQNCKQTISFDIFGSVYNQEYWQQCLNIIKNLPANIKVNYKNEIEPEKVNEVISNYHFLYLPTLGENFGHSIFESFTAGVPVIISDKTPWRNLEVRKCGFDLPLESESKFTELIDKLALQSQDEYNLFSQGALDFANEFINNKEIKQQNLNLFYHLLT
jgi:glycosyltransferase involved in cell wall biosynthesis